MADTNPASEYRQSRFQAPPGATEFLLVRHGESEPALPDRPFPLVDGHGDPELAPEGREHAELVARRLAGVPLDAIYVTSLRRTVQTARPLAARHGITPRVEADLREVRLGEWEGGLFRRMVAEGHPLVFQARAEGRWDVIPGAEPADVLAARVRAAINRLADAHTGQRVAVITHAGVIDAIISLASGSRLLSFLGADNCSISHLVVVGEAWIVRGFNDTGHLDALPPPESAPPT